MHEIGFIRDLAVVMIVAGATTILFQRMRQPVLLGYILAGVLIGPHTPGVLVGDPRTIDDISNLGVVLLMFTLGLEFSVRKLREVGIGVLAAAVAEVGLMLWIGYGIGGLFGWTGMDALFLGAIISLSSTMVATRTLAESGQRHQPFAQLVVGLLVAEDMLAIVMLTLLTAVAIGGSVQAETAFTLVGHLGLFVIVGMILGLLLLPRLVDYVAGFDRDETLLVSVLGICFGTSLLAAWMGFSVALGAFLAGAVVAESRSVGRVLHLVEPLRDMFAALFFVAIGLKIDPAMLLQYALPALLIAAVVIVGKTLACSLGIFVVGHDARTALRSGLGMAQIGEFSFVIATLGLSLGVISDFIYPIAVAVSVLCMAASPYMNRSADGLANGLRRVTPRSLRLLATSYSGWLENLKPVNENAAIAAMFRRLLWHIGINVLLVVALFVIGAYINTHNWSWFSMLGIDRNLRHTLIWAGALFLSLPMLIAVYRKAEALGMLLAEIGIRERFAGSYTLAIRNVLARVIPLATLLALALLVSGLSSAILPPRGIALSLIVLGVVVAVVLWRGLVKMHARLQAALKETLEKPGPSGGGAG
ncbi:MULTISPECIES: cation:proton antiporter [Rhodanobacter]|uniref:cation:proton antiporter n=1 Tax=Rhodanobacter TaxID=75309 RepID=UPI0004135577|nr:MULTISPECIES: cation:proton antiporter [Rhodanobacter]KZC20566.1 potassium transporter [Rhodanobacter denitrificans]UJJ49545.1 cation:proton antiporter [Rhodanobacter denitrificans]UJM92259.1 cation:proton antiporter [Rhodanobacter denitrificans]UJM95788.1 cation:proton antiporter [Rhodanobacter denitrificans]UJN21381.1 cation:proton antiporter [Rhodanobacter denitrificans]